MYDDEADTTLPALRKHADMDSRVVAVRNEYGPDGPGSSFLGGLKLGF